MKKTINIIKTTIILALIVAGWLYIANRREKRIQEEQRTMTEQECENMEKMVEITNEMIQRYE